MSLPVNRLLVAVTPFDMIPAPIAAPGNGLQLRTCSICCDTCGITISALALVEVQASLGREIVFLCTVCASEVFFGKQTADGVLIDDGTTPQLYRLCRKRRLN